MGTFSFHLSCEPPPHPIHGTFRILIQDPEVITTRDTTAFLFSILLCLGLRYNLSVIKHRNLECTVQSVLTCKGIHITCATIMAQNIPVLQESSLMPLLSRRPTPRGTTIMVKATTILTCITITSSCLLQNFTEVVVYSPGALVSGSLHSG